MTGRALRSLLAVAAAALCAAGVVPIDGAPFVAPGSALADEGRKADDGRKADARKDEGVPPVGARLVAVVDVELDEAVVRAGSHVSVVARQAKAGRVLLDVALADGHVVRGVPLAQVRSAFRVANA